MCFPESNKMLRPPSGMTEKECGSLAVLSYAGDRIHASKWRMSFRERISALLFGRCWVFVHMPKTQPPIALLVTRTIFSPRGGNKHARKEAERA